MSTQLVFPATFPNNLPKGWRDILAPEAETKYFKKLTQFLRVEYKKKTPIFPERPYVLRALRELDFNDVKVVILGQDPYHGPGQAIGRCFAVPNDLRVKPPSLVNIFKEIEKDLGLSLDRNASELSTWVKQGVLLLNTVLTVRKAEAFSHREQGWEKFSDRVISTLNARQEPVIFILWGAPARKKKLLITSTQHFIIESAHPSPLSAYSGFFGSRPFSKANEILRKLGKSPIDWNVTG